MSLAAAVQRVRDELRQWGDHSEPPVTTMEEPPRRGRRTVEHLSGWGLSQPQVVSREEARRLIEDDMRSFALASSDDRQALIVTAQPGLGKTYYAVRVVNEAVAAGKKVLWLMPQHDMWWSMTNFEESREEEWHHWRSFSSPNPDNPEETMCRLAYATSAWMSKGYALHDACNALCPIYKSSCPYKLQRKRKEPVIFGVHEHIVTGLSIDDFDFAVIDEVALRAFLQPRLIPLNGVLVEGGYGPVFALQQELIRIAVDGQRLSGPALLERIGPLLTDAYNFIEDPESDMTPFLPTLMQPEDVTAAPYWYLPDLLSLLIPEYMAWKQDLPAWVERVAMSPNGLELDMRGRLWVEAPNRLIVLDATAKKEIYSELLGGYNLKFSGSFIEGAGELIQVADSTYNKSSMVNLRTKKPTNKAHKVAAYIRDTCQKMGYKDPAVISFMQLEELFAKVIPNVKTGHFYGSTRGSNFFEDCDALFVVGTPMPPRHELVRMASIIFWRRFTPFPALNEPVDEMLRPYLMQNEDGTVPAILTTGYWGDPQLQSVLEIYREDELRQSANRTRWLNRETPVYLITSVPIDMPVDRLLLRLDDMLDTPAGFTWEQWNAAVRWALEQPEIDYNSLAAAVGVSPRWARKQRWLDTIAQHYPETFRVERLSSGRGPQRQALRKLT